MMTEPVHLTPGPLGGWPQFHPKMMREYGGNWVAVITRTRTYLGKGKTPEEAHLAGRDAAARRGLDPDELSVYAVCRPEDAWF
jgi:hypothetical protein